jgi:hypothetical protein
MSCHFVIFLIKMFRDQLPNMVIPLHLTSFNSCEILFSRVEGMVEMEKAGLSYWAFEGYRVGGWSCPLRPIRNGYIEHVL